MAFLPLCHIAERLGGEYHSLYAGAVLNFVENPETVPENVREIAPTVFTAVPRVWEKFYSGVLIRLKEAGALQQWAYAVAIGIGYQAGRRCARRASRSRRACALAFWLARLLVLNNVRKVIGVHRAKVLRHRRGADLARPDALVHGARRGDVRGVGADRVLRRRHLEPGGQGEAGLDRAADAARRGASSRPRASCWCAARRVFMGYLNQPEKTAETLKDGWLHTGDVGKVDAEGFFYITDRMKDIIITAGGKNITPSEFENQLKFSPYITDAVVIGDKRPYLVALVMIDHENVENYAQDHAIPFSNYASLCRRPEIIGLIQGEIDKVNKALRARRAGEEVPPDGDTSSPRRTRS